MCSPSEQLAPLPQTGTVGVAQRQVGAHDGLAALFKGGVARKEPLVMPKDGGILFRILRHGVGALRIQRGHDAGQIAERLARLRGKHP